MMLRATAIATNGSRRVQPVKPEIATPPITPAEVHTSVRR
jgi:hypothetical protein